MRPTRADIFESVKVDYKLATNVLGAAIFLALFALTRRRGATDPMCGMRVDKQSAVVVRRGAHTDHFCSQHCADAYAASRPAVSAAPHDPQRARVGDDLVDDRGVQPPIFYFGVMSPYSWFAAERIGRLLPQARWRGVLAGVVFKEHGRTSWGLTDRRADGIADCEMRAAEHGLGPIRVAAEPGRPATCALPARWRSANGSTQAANGGRHSEPTAAAACSSSRWRRCAWPSSRAPTSSSSTACSRPAVVARSTRTTCASALEDQQVKDQLRAITGEAIAAGVFGVPTVRVGDQLFWGDDRLQDAANAYRVEADGAEAAGSPALSLAS